MSTKSDINGICEQGIQFTNSVLRVCIITLQFRLYTLRSFSWHTLSSYMVVLKVLLAVVVLTAVVVVLVFVVVVVVVIVKVNSP